MFCQKRIEDVLNQDILKSHNIDFNNLTLKSIFCMDFSQFFYAFQWALVQCVYCHFFITWTGKHFNKLILHNSNLCWDKGNFFSKTFSKYTPIRFFFNFSSKSLDRACDWPRVEIWIQILSFDWLQEIWRKNWREIG